MKPEDHKPASHRWGWHPHAWPERVKILLLLAALVAGWGWIDVRVRGTVDPQDPGIHKTDFTVYTEAGAAFFDGREPYEVTNPRGWGYLYPPPFAMLVAPLHALPPRAGVLIWFALSALVTYGCYTESVRIARTVLPGEPQNAVFGPIPMWIGWAAITASLLPALNCLQRGQVGIAKLYLLLLGFRLCVESRTVARSFLGGAILALPIVLKVSPLVPVGFLIVEQIVAGWYAPARAAGLRRGGAAAGGVAFGLVLLLLLVPSTLVGWRTNLDHLDTWWHSVATRLDENLGDEFAGDSSSPRNQSLTNAVERLGNWTHYAFAGGPHDEDPTPQRANGQRFLMDAPIVGTILLVVRVAAALLLLPVGYRMARAQDALGLAAAFGMAGVATLILAPIARGHYFVLLLPATMFTSAWLLRRGRRRWAVWIAAVPAVASVTHYVLLDVAGRIGLLGISTTVWYAAACVALWRLAPTAAALDLPSVEVQHERASDRRVLAA